MSKLIPLLILLTIAMRANAIECERSASDPDGDGWGWENNVPCQVTADSSGAPQFIDPDTNAPVNLQRPLWQWFDLESKSVTCIRETYTQCYTGWDASTGKSIFNSRWSTVDCGDSMFNWRLELTSSATGAGQFRYYSSGPSYSGNYSWSVTNGLPSIDYTDVVQDWDGQPSDSRPPKIIGSDYVEPVSGFLTKFRVWGDERARWSCSGAQPSNYSVAVVPTSTPVCVDTDPEGDGWGWNGAESCVVGGSSSDNISVDSPGPSACVDTDPLGDGWGWNGAESCMVGGSHGSNDSVDSLNTSACVDTDPVGDGWGWNGTESCAVGNGNGGNNSVESPSPSMCVDTDPVGDGWGWNGAESCLVVNGNGGNVPGDSVNSLACIDTDPVGDGWGWNGTESCAVGSGNGGNSSVESPSSSMCVDTDPVGDGWGWDGAASCIVSNGNGSEGAIVSPQTSICVDTAPVGDGWGWNGTESCVVDGLSTTSGASVEPQEIECLAASSDADGDGFGYENGGSCVITENSFGPPVVYDPVLNREVELTRLQWEWADVADKLVTCTNSYAAPPYFDWVESDIITTAYFGSDGTWISRTGVVATWTLENGLLRPPIQIAYPFGSDALFNSYGIIENSQVVYYTAGHHDYHGLIGTGLPGNTRRVKAICDVLPTGG